MQASASCDTIERLKKKERGSRGHTKSLIFRLSVFRKLVFTATEELPPKKMAISISMDGPVHYLPLKGRVKELSVLPENSKPPKYGKAVEPSE